MGNVLDKGFDLSEKNILEELYEMIEKHSLSPNSDFQLGDFYDILNNFDLSYQKFNSANSDETNAIVNEYLIRSLSVFIAFFKIQGFTDRPFFYAFKRFLYWFGLVLEKSYGIKAAFFFERNFSENFPFLWDNDTLSDLLNLNKKINLVRPSSFNLMKERIEHAEYDIAADFGFGKKYQEQVKSLLIFGNDFTVTKLNISEEDGSLNEVGHYYEMMLDITVSDKENDGSKMLHNLNLIVASIASIDNVKVEIEDIKIGSLFARIRIHIQDLVGKEECKSVLETTKEAVFKTLTAGQVSHTEVNKNVAETKKIKTEQQLLEKELDSKPSDFEAKMSNALDLERKSLENEQLRVKLANDKLVLLGKLSELATKGIVEADDVRIDINEVMYLLYQNGQYTPIKDSNIDDIT